MGLRKRKALVRWRSRKMGAVRVGAEMEAKPRVLHEAERGRPPEASPGPRVRE